MAANYGTAVLDMQPIVQQHNGEGKLDELALGMLTFVLLYNYRGS